MINICKENLNIQTIFRQIGALCRCIVDLLDLSYLMKYFKPGILFI